MRMRHVISFATIGDGVAGQWRLLLKKSSVLFAVGASFRMKTIDKCLYRRIESYDFSVSRHI